MSLVQEQTKSNPVVAPAGRLEGKVALITGGTRGIGLAVAKAYAREGAKLVIAARTAGELKTALAELKELGAEAVATKVDLTSEDACRSLYSGALRSFGKIDILVNNAAVLGTTTSILNYPSKDWDEVLRTNLDVVFWLTRATLGTMIPNNGGSIINVISGVALKGMGNWGAYSVSKAAVLNFSQVLAEEVAQYNVRVNCVNPGPTRTMMRAEAAPGEDPASLPAPDEIVNPFIYLAADASRGVSGLAFDSRDWMGRSF